MTDIALQNTHKVKQRERGRGSKSGNYIFSFPASISKSNPLHTNTNTETEPIAKFKFCLFVPSRQCFSKGMSSVLQLWKDKLKPNINRVQP